LALATSQFAWVMAPFWWMASVRSETQGRFFRWITLFKVSAGAIGIAMIVFFPIFLMDPGAFIKGVFFYLFHSIDSFPRERCLGLSSVFHSMGCQKALLFLQVATLGLLGVFGLWVWSKRGSPGRMIQIGVFCFFLFLIWSHFSENYFYLSPLLILLLGSSGTVESRERP
jgi:hypothetical protein